MSRIKGFGGIREINRRIKGSDVIVDNRDALATELINLGTSKITDILTWNEQGEVDVKASKDIPDYALSAIKKIRVFYCIQTIFFCYFFINYSMKIRSSI